MSIPSYSHAIRQMSAHLDEAKQLEIRAKKCIKDNKNVTSKQEQAAKAAYNSLHRQVSQIQGKKLRLEKDKIILSSSYKGAGFLGIKQKIKDILKFCWGPKATIRKEIKHLDSLQKTMERKMASLNPEEFASRSRTRIDQAKAATKVLKGRLNEAVKNHKADVKFIKKWESFVKASPKASPEKALDRFTEKEIKDIRKESPKFNELYSAFSKARMMGADKDKILGIVREMQKELRTNLPRAKKSVNKMGKALKADQRQLMQRQLKHFFGIKVAPPPRG